MQSIFNIRFAKLNLDYNRTKISQELLELRPHFQMLPPRQRFAVPHPKIYVGTDQEIQSVTVWDENNVLHKKNIEPWYGLSFTHLPGNVQSKIGSNMIRNSSTTAWQWRNDVESPSIRALVDSLDFHQLHSVRVMLLPAGGIGLVHQDDKGEYYKKHISITLNITHGGSKLIFLHNEQTYHIQDEPAFLFRDDCWHGVPRTTSNRIQLRINGIPNRDRISSLVDNVNLMMV